MSIRRWLAAFGFEPQKLRRGLRELPRFWRGWKQVSRTVSWPSVAPSFPCLHDRTAPSGEAMGHYFHQDLQVARRIYEKAPKTHVDVGSRLDGFVAHLAVFRAVVYIDLRSPPEVVPGIEFRMGDLLDARTLPSGCESVSCLHVIEHVGLGRYGDSIDPEGWARAVTNLASMLASGGCLYLSVPIGKQRVEFNAHRVFAPNTVVTAARQNGLWLTQFAWIDDSGAFHNMDASIDVERILVDLEQLEYGCGLFEFVKQ